MSECKRFDAIEAVNIKIIYLWDETFSSLVCKPHKHCIWKQHHLVSPYPNTGRHILDDCEFNPYPTNVEDRVSS